MEKRRIIGLLLAGALSLSLAACGGGTAQTPAPAQSGSPSQSDAPAAGKKTELNVAIAQDLDDSLDPHKAVAAGTKEIMFNVFEGLVKPTSEGDLVPAVAEKWTVSDDGKTYTFTLRQGVKFHNGDPVEMRDVVYSLERCRGTYGEETAIPALSAIASMEANDDTLTVTLEQPDPEFLSNLTLAILPEDYDQQDTQPVGTGPFQFVSRSAQENIIMERFDDYWGGPAYMEKITFKIVENGDSILMGLQSGAIDLCSHLTSTQVAQLGDDFYTAEGTMNLVQALYLNNDVAPFDDVRVRQALCYAVDRQAIIDLAFDGYGSLIGSSMYPAFGKYFMPELTDYYTTDVEKAKALLAEAGYADGFDMTITVPSNYQPHVDTAQVLVEQLKAINVNAEIQMVEWGTWVSDVYGGRQFQSTVVGVDASTMTARALLERFASDHNRNFINYDNAEYDALFAQAITTYDDAAQTELYKQMERNLTENAANVYIQDLADLVAVRKGLEGVTFYPIYVQDMYGLRWSE